MQQRQTLLHHGRAQAATGDTGFAGLAGTLQCPLQSRLIDFQEQHGNAGADKTQGDAHAHGAATDHPDTFNVTHGRVLGQVVDLGTLALGKKGVYQRRTLLRGQALLEQCALALQAFGQWQQGRRFYRGDTAGRGKETRQTLADLQAFGGDQRGVVRALEGGGLFTGAPHTQAVIQHALGKGDGGGARITVEQFIDNVMFPGVSGVDGLAGDNHLQGLGHTGQTGQALGAARARQQPELDLRQADLGIAAGDSIMATQGHFQASAQGRAVNHRDTGFVALFIGVDHFRQARRLGRLAELLDISPGNESAASAQQHQHLGLRVDLALMQGAQQTFTRGLTEGIDRRVVQGDQCNLALALVAHAGIHLNLDILFLLKPYSALRNM